MITALLDRALAPDSKIISAAGAAVEVRETEVSFSCVDKVVNCTEPFVTAAVVEGLMTANEVRLNVVFVAVGTLDAAVTSAVVDKSPLGSFAGVFDVVLAVPP